MHILAAVSIAFLTSIRYIKLDFFYSSYLIHLCSFTRYNHPKHLFVENIFFFMYILDAVSHFYHLKLHYFFSSYFIKWYLFMWNNLPEEPPMEWGFKGGGANITKKNQNSSTSQISSLWMLSAKSITSQKLKNQFLFLEIWSIL